ncbi:hypothetical protein HN569_03745 [bacterium]|nr:hypothetical protein [bacterium]
MQRKVAVKVILSTLITFVIVFFGVNFYSETKNSKTEVQPVKEVTTSVVEKQQIQKKEIVELGIDIPIKPPSMEVMKKRGCIADGLLNGYDENTGKALKMINRSECQYLHRAIETWLEAPDFLEIRKNKEEIIKQDMIYGMFLAEAIDTKAEYYYPDEDRMFDFSAMCNKATKNYWGEHTCRPSMRRTEYKKYLKFITEQAIDIGVQSFMFGQVFYQDSTSDPEVDKVIKEMRKYAAVKGIEIVIGAQTNDIVKKSYLKKFDYIEGGVGLGSDGSFEDGPCFSRWWKNEGDWCWALLWNKRYSSLVENVFIHLDWSGKLNDDMSTFAQMDETLRAETLEKLHTYFTKQGHGFLMPMLAVLPKKNGGCYGSKKRSYSSDKRYSCGDEDTINEIIKKANIKTFN